MVCVAVQYLMPDIPPGRSMVASQLLDKSVNNQSPITKSPIPITAEMKADCRGSGKYWYSGIFVVGINSSGFAWTYLIVRF